MVTTNPWVTTRQALVARLTKRQALVARVTRLALPLALASALLGAGCPCDSGVPDLFYDGFQEVCDGLPCGWDVDAGDVASVVSFHSGELGMRLAVAGAAARDLPDTLLPGSDEGGAQVSLLAACDGATGLVVEVDILSAAAGGTSGETEQLTLSGHLDPQPGASAGGPLLLRQLALSLPGQDPVPTGTAVRIRVALDGPGVCTIDELHLAASRANQCLG